MSKISKKLTIPKNKILLAFTVMLFCFFNLCNAKRILPTVEIDLYLKKDEVVYARVVASKDSQSVSAMKDFTMRWTLYRNDGLVVLVRYDKYPYHFVLYRDYSQNRFTLNLLDPQGINRDLSQPRLHIEFVGINNPFNDEKTVAHIRVYGFGNMDFTRQ